MFPPFLFSPSPGLPTVSSFSFPMPRYTQYFLSHRNDGDPVFVQGLCTQRASLSLFLPTSGPNPWPGTPVCPPRLFFYIPRHVLHAKHFAFLRAHQASVVFVKARYRSPRSLPPKPKAPSLTDWQHYGCTLLFNFPFLIQLVGTYTGPFFRLRTIASLSNSKLLM